MARLLVAALVLVAMSADSALARDRTSLGKPLPTCEEAQLDFTNTGCTVATFYGELSVTHETHAGGMLKGTVARSGGCEQSLCPIDWGGLERLGKGKCDPKSDSCSIEIDKDAHTTPYTGVQVGINGGITRDYYAIIGKGHYVLAGRVADADGKAVANKRILVRGEEDAAATTDEFGEYILAMPKGRYTVSTGVKDKLSPVPSADCQVAGRACAVLLNRDRRKVNFEVPKVEPLAVHLRSAKGGTGKVRLRLTLENPSKFALTDLAVRDLAVTGKGALKLESGPTPAPPAGLAAGGEATVTYVLTVTRAGPVRVTATATGDDPDHQAHGDGSAVELEAAPAPDKVDRWVEIIAAFEQALEKERKKVGRLNTAIGNAGPRKAFGSQNLGVGAAADIPAAWSWLPGSGTEAWKAAGYIHNGIATELPEAVSDKFNKIANYIGETGSTAFEFWGRNLGYIPQSDQQLMNQSVALTSIVLDEPKAKLNDQLGLIRDFWTSGHVKDQIAMNAGLEEAMGDALARYYDKGVERVNKELEGFSRDVKKDPEGAWTSLGRKATRTGVDVGVDVAVNVVGPAVFAKLSKVASATGIIELGGETLEALEAESVISLTQAEEVGGILQSDSTKIQQVLRNVEAEHPEVGRLEFQVRPTATESIPVLQRGGIPKPECLKEKAITRLDVALGADEGALGQVGVFKPTLPPASALRNLGEEERRVVVERFSKRAEEYHKVTTGQSNLNFAAQEGGADFPLGNNRTAHMEVGFEQIGDTVVVRNKNLVLDGRTIGKPGAQFASDIDPHALIEYGADKNLSQEVRSQIELKVKTQLEQLGVNTGGHGWTFSGFDYANAKSNAFYRGEWLLRYNDKNAEKWIKQLQKLLPEDKMVQALTPESLRERLGKPKFVIKYTAEDIRVGYGPSVPVDS